MGVVSAIHTPRLMKEGLSPCFLNEGEEWVVNRKGAKRGTWQTCGQAGTAFHLGTHVRSLLLSLSCEACRGTNPNRARCSCYLGEGSPLRKGQQAFQHPDSGNCLRGGLGSPDRPAEGVVSCVLSRLLVPKALLVFALPFSSAT